jgi:hypothetical protein
VLLPLLLVCAQHTCCCGDAPRPAPPHPTPPRPTAFGQALEKYFLPGIVALGVICGGLAAKTYNDGASAFVKP